MGDNTPKLNLFRPFGEDPMSDVKKNINDNFKAIADYVTPPNGVSLPLSASVGDLFYVNGTGHYLCVVNDTDWGIIWRPIETAVGPWKTIPSSCILGANNINSPEWPFSIMMDNRGIVHLRGAIKNDINGFPNSIPPASVQVLRALPANLRPAMPATFLLPAETGPNNAAEYCGGRMHLFKDGSSQFNFWNSSGAFYLFFDTVFWAAGEGTYYSG